MTLLLTWAGTISFSLMFWAGLVLVLGRLLK